MFPFFVCGLDSGKTVERNSSFPQSLPTVGQFLHKSDYFLLYQTAAPPLIRMAVISAQGSINKASVVPIEHMNSLSITFRDPIT